MNTFQKKSPCKLKDPKVHADLKIIFQNISKNMQFLFAKISSKFRLISKLNLGWLVNLIYVNFWPKFQSVNHQIYVNFDLSKITNLRDSRCECCLVCLAVLRRHWTQQVQKRRLLFARNHALHPWTLSLCVCMPALVVAVLIAYDYECARKLSASLFLGSQKQAFLASWLWALIVYIYIIYTFTLYIHIDV